MFRLFILLIYATSISQTKASTSTKANTIASRTTNTTISTTPEPDIPDLQSFDALVKQPYFVDKSDLLQVFFDQSASKLKYPVYFITCPRNFGKTTNLDMIRQFVQLQLDSSKKTLRPNETTAYNLFKSLKISKHNATFSTHLARYPVVYLDLVDITLLGLKVSNVLEELQLRMSDLIDTFVGMDTLINYFKTKGPTQDLDTEMDEIFFLQKLKDNLLNERQVDNALYMLVKIYHEYFEGTKIVILIDEYDNDAVNFYQNKDTNVAFVYKIINEMLKRTFDLGREYIQFVVVNAVTCLSYSLDNSMHDMMPHYPFLEEHRFTPYYGFSDDEVTQLCTSYKCDETEQKTIKEYYNGYRSTGKRIVYNPYSIAEYFKARKDQKFTTAMLKSYWKQSGGWRYIAAFLKNDLFREKIGILIQSREVQHPIRKLYEWNALFQLEELRDRDYEGSEDYHVDMFFSLYFELGLLSHVNEKDIYTIPNNEVQNAYEEILRAFHKPTTISTKSAVNATRRTAATASKPAKP